MPTLDDRVLIELHKAAVAARRPGIVVVSRDAGQADALTGSRARTHQSIRRIVRADRAVSVRRDLLVLRNQIGVAQATVLDLIDAIAPAYYMVSAGHALEAHGLTRERFREAAVLVTRPVTGFEWGRHRVRFLVVAADRLWGGRRLTINPARPGPVVASPERAILDAIAHERFGVTLRQAASSLRDALSEDPELAGRLAEAARRYGVAAVARRAGLLVERIAGEAASAPFAALVGTGPAPVPLRAGAPPSGPVNTRWRVQINTVLEL